MFDQRPVHLFYSYADKDRNLCETLDKHLKPLQREGLLTSWQHHKIQAGSERQQKIDEHLNAATFILLLISPDFLDSDYCYNYEMQHALELHSAGKAHVIPVILRPCNWQTALFGSLQALPRNGLPITKWPDKDEAFLEIEQDLRALLKQFQETGHVVGGSHTTTRKREVMRLYLQRLYQRLLAESLQGTVWIELGLAELPGAVQNTTNLILRRTTQPGRLLPPNTSVLQIYQEANQELLILGAPGTGKSTMLYRLGHDLLTKAGPDVTQPLPVLFPLSSWAKKRLPLATWMAEQLASPLYPVSFQHWLQEEQFFIPMLDGLDEMEEYARHDCIAAINAYRHKHPLCPLIVCSRSDEYRAATIAIEGEGRLYLQTAIEIQLLAPVQLDTLLLHTGMPVAALRSELETNEELHNLALTPLWLNVLLLTFHDTSIDELSRQRFELEQQVCARYVQRMIDEKGQRERYPLEQTKRWLSWLAEQMREQNQPLFAVEVLQPDWLARHTYMFYRWSIGVVAGLVTGIPVGLALGLISGLHAGLLAGLVVGPLVGLVVGLLVGLVAGLVVGQKRIVLAESMIWSWKGARNGLIVAVFIMLVAALAFKLSGLVIALLFGLSIELLAALVQKPCTVRERHTLSPGEGLRRSLRNGLIIGLPIGLIIGLLFGLLTGLTIGLSGGLLTGLTIGLSGGLLFGPLAVAQHFLLRFWLWRVGIFPFYINSFLEDACARHLLRRVGGGYQFVHRLLLDYFADLYSTVSFDEDSAESTPTI